MKNEKASRKIDVEYVANLARLTLDKKTLKRFSKQFDKIIEYINKLNEVDTSSVEPTSHILPMKNVLREDEVEPSLSLEEVLKNAPESKEGFFKVPKVMEG